MNTMMRKLLLILCLMTLPASVLSTPPGAAPRVTDSFEALESEVRKAHPVTEILEMTSQLRSFQNWPASADPKLKFYVAVQWVNQRRFGEAFALLQTLKSAPLATKMWRFYAAQSALEIGRMDEFTTIVNEMAKENPQDLDYAFLKSMELMWKQNFVDATQLLTALIDKDPLEEGKLHLQRGIVYVYSLSHALALEDFKKAIKKLPKEDISRRQMAYLQAGLIELKFFNNPKKSRPFFKKGVALDPNSELVRDLSQRKDL